MHASGCLQFRSSVAYTDVARVTKAAKGVNALIAWYSLIARSSLDLQTQPSLAGCEASIHACLCNCSSKTQGTQYAQLQESRLTVDRV